MELANPRYVVVMPAALAQLTIPRLGIQPHHHVLEIGCGGGTAVSAVAELLETGAILAIDRSAANVARATRRNARHVGRGVASIVQVDLDDLDVPAQSFDTIFALNVNLFQVDQERTVGFIRRALRRRGRLVLGYGRRNTDQLGARADRICTHLRAGGMVSVDAEWAGDACLYILARRS